MSITQQELSLDTDNGFAGSDGYPNTRNLPEPDLDFSQKGDNAPANPEVVVDVRQSIETGDKAEGFEEIVEDVTGEDFEAGTQFDSTTQYWIRLPVTEVVEWINRDGPADMTRTARVKFSFEWGGQSIIQYINGFNSQNTLASQTDPYDECRIFFYDNSTREWRIAHYGYVGGVGPANKQGVGKFWVYDPADLMKGIQVSKNWSNPSIQSVIKFAISGNDNNGNPVGLERRSVFESIKVSLLGKADIPRVKQQNTQKDLGSDGGGFKLGVGPFSISIGGVFGDILSFSGGVASSLVGGGAQKRFQLNRHNMVDLMDWFTDLIDARWWFEPSQTGPILVIDATAFKEGEERGSYERRYFVEDNPSTIDKFRELQRQARQEALEVQEIKEELEIDLGNEELNEQLNEAPGGVFDTDAISDFLPPHNYNIYEFVNVLNNDALVDIKPFNTLYLYGESTTIRERYAIGTVSSPGIYTEEYPWVKVTYQPLIERAGGYEYSSEPIESDKVYLQQAEEQAKKEFRKHIAEQTEGSIQLQGEPAIMPYDYLVATTVCNDTYPNVEVEPITWEVNGVKHIRKADDVYKTELAVSLAIEDRNITVESEYRKS